MPIDRSSASTHLRKLSQVPYFHTVSSEAFSSWVTALADSCDDIPHAIRAVDVLIAGRVLPGAPDDIRDAVEASRVHRTAAHYPGGCCGRIADGKTYLSHDYRTEATPEEVRLEATPPQYLFPAKCVAGWVHWTEWRPSGLLDESGAPAMQPYEFSGRCKCQPGGWV